MDEKTFTLDVITPERMAYRGLVTSFTAPGVEGSFQVLHSHAPLLSAIAPGIVKILTADGAIHLFATSGGFVEVLDNTVVLLAETAERSDEIDAQRARAARERAEKRLKSHDPGIDVERARASLTRALNRLRVVDASK